MNQAQHNGTHCQSMTQRSNCLQVSASQAEQSEQATAHFGLLPQSRFPTEVQALRDLDFGLSLMYEDNIRRYKGGSQRILPQTILVG